MTDYRRIVSYLYKYERGRKGANAGYVRIDIRQGTLKLLIHAQDNKCLKEKDFQVYFYYHKNGALRGIHGGTMRFYQGESEFRKETREDSIFDSPFSFEMMGGILLYYNGELAYGTEWDNQPIVMNNFQVEDGRTDEREEKKDTEERKEIKETFEQSKSMEEVQQEDVLEVLKDEEQQEVEEVFEEFKEAEEESEPFDVAIQEERIEDLGVKQNQVGGVREEYIERKNISENIENFDDEEKKDKIIDIPGLSLDRDTFFGLQAIYNGNYQEEDRQSQEIQLKTDLDYQKVEEKAREEVHLEEKVFENLEIEQDRVEQLMRESPRLNHGNNPQILSMARIYPQDIGRLEIPDWHFGSNSFLIHGYYEYQYIVVGKIRQQDGTVRSILGVPGVYTNQENYMAAQFGFKEFLPVKLSQTKTGSFGYWITYVNEHRA